MRYGQIIKKAWAITWRFRYLWVLGIFAGITGWGGQGGGSYNGGRSFGSSGSTSSSTSNLPFSARQFEQFGPTLARWVPILIAAVVIWVIVALLLLLLRLASQGGLVWAVNEIEDGREPTLSDAWREGFARWWRVLGLGLLLGLPTLLVVLVLVAVIVVPLGMAFSRGGAAAAAAIVPVCGAIAIGVPVVLVMSFVLGIMYVIALRRIVLDDIGPIQSAKDAWKTFRARFKDTALMWLINWGLNIVAGLALAIPIVIVTLIMAVPAIAAGVSQRWGTVAVLVGVWLLVLVIVSVIFTAIWGTFTSALWTILYRRMTGREVVIPPTGYTPAMPGGPPVAPAYPAARPPVPGAPPVGYPPAPTAGWVPAHTDAPGWSPDASVTGSPRGQTHDPYSQPTGEMRPPLDPYRGSQEPRPPLDPYTPWQPGPPPAEQPPHE